MRSPARAIAWEFFRRHRWGWIAIAGYLLVLAAARLLGFAPGPAEPSPERFAATVALPQSAVFLYLLAVFSFGFSGDLAARQSMYPSRLFTLPVTTAALAGWPMLYGTVAIAGLWLSMARLALWPEAGVPLVWPAVLAAVILAWTQALTWMPYPLRGLRIAAAVLCLVMIDVVAVVALEVKPPESLMVAVLAPQLPLAYWAARIAVARARRGEIPDWSGDWRQTFTRLGQAADVLLRRRRPFPSPERAQVWWEWRQHGWALPVWVGILLPFELAALFAVRDTPVLLRFLLIGVLLTPPVLAAFVAATVRRAGPSGSDVDGLPPFLAARPLTSAALLAAKLRVTVRSTLAAWLLVLVALPPVLLLSGTWRWVVDDVHRMSATIGTPRAVVIGLLGLAGLVSATWKQLVQSLYIGLSGRTWLIRASLGLTLAFLAAVVPLAQWISAHHSAEAALWDALSWFPAVLVGIKMSASSWTATRLHRTGLLSERTLVIGAASWLAAVLALYALLAWLVDTPHIPHYFLVLVAILAVPLARLSAAPLALARNRHQ
jgi:hypothetical protein